MSVLLFTSRTCPYCDDIRAWLGDKGVCYEEVRITDSRAHLRAWRELTGGHGVPAIIFGRRVVVGFRPDVLLQALEGGELK